MREIVLGDVRIDRLYTSYGGGKQGEVIALAASTGFLEIAVNLGSAARRNRRPRGRPREGALVIVHYRHPWDVSYQEAVGWQQRLRDELVLSGDTRTIRIVAGADVSYERRGLTFFAGVVVMDAGTFEIIEEAHHVGPVSFPYVPGLLSFREGPVMLAAFEKLSTVPDAVIFDGQGIAHPRGLGLAAHMGILLGIPTVGSAKTRLVGEYGDVGNERGSDTALIHDGRNVGYVVRSKEGTTPIFVSPGHLISAEAAVELVLMCTARYRIPEPVRQAHMLVNRLRKESYTKHMKRIHYVLVIIGYLVLFIAFQFACVIKIPRFAPGDEFLDVYVSLMSSGDYATLVKEVDSLDLTSLPSNRRTRSHLWRGRPPCTSRITRAARRLFRVLPGSLQETGRSRPVSPLAGLFPRRGRRGGLYDGAAPHGDVPGQRLVCRCKRYDRGLLCQRWATTTKRPVGLRRLSYPRTRSRITIPTVLFLKGKAMEESGKKNDALAIYKQVWVDYPASAAAADAFRWYQPPGNDGGLDPRRR